MLGMKFLVGLGNRGKEPRWTTTGVPSDFKYRERADEEDPCKSQHKPRQQEGRAGRNLGLYLILGQHISIMLAISSMQRDSAFHV